MSRNVIVIGGVALGPKAASRLKRLDPTANVTMIDENINISFGGCGIPYYVSGEINSLDALRSTTYGTVRTPEYFEHKGVHTPCFQEGRKYVQKRYRHRWRGPRPQGGQPPETA